MKKNIAMASFYCLVNKIWKKNIILCRYKKGEKTLGLRCFLSAKKLTPLCRFVISKS